MTKLRLGEKIKMGVSVSKKNSRKPSIAIIKRVLRETYRLNKHLLIDNLPYSFMFFYQTKDRLSYEEINTKTIQLFESFASNKKEE
jgi:ribonuclease P protein component